MIGLHFDSRYNPWQHASTMNLRIRYAELPPRLRGLWDLASRTIVLSRGLTQTERRCVLSHELVHAERLDTGQCASSWHENKVEQLVQAKAAKRLITIADLRLAWLLHEDEWNQAEMCWVDVPMLRARVASLTQAERDQITSWGLSA